jgi:hypothetical protein
MYICTNECSELETDSHTQFPTNSAELLFHSFLKSIWMCVCVWERESEWEREGEREKNREFGAALGKGNLQCRFVLLYNDHSNPWRTYDIVNVLACMTLYYVMRTRLCLFNWNNFIFTYFLVNFNWRDSNQPTRDRRTTSAFHYTELFKTVL